MRILICILVLGFQTLNAETENMVIIGKKPHSLKIIDHTLCKLYWLKNISNPNDTIIHGLYINFMRKVQCGDTITLNYITNN